jgi:hypothetical protein
MPLRVSKVRMIRRGLTHGHANGKTVVTVADIPAIAIRVSERGTTIVDAALI